MCWHLYVWTKTRGAQPQKFSDVLICDKLKSQLIKKSYRSSRDKLKSLLNELRRRRQNECKAEEANRFFFQELNEKLSAITASSRAELASKTKDLESAKEKLASLQKSSTDKARFYENEMKKLTDERVSLREYKIKIEEMLKEVKLK